MLCYISAHSNNPREIMHNNVCVGLKKFASGINIHVGWSDPFGKGGQQGLNILDSTAAI